MPEPITWMSARLPAGLTVRPTSSSISALRTATPTVSGNQAFQFVGTAGFTQPGGEVRLANFDGATLVMVDNDGDSAAEMVFLLHGATGLVAGDFIL